MIPKILDMYDDKGQHLKEIFPDKSKLPPIIKEANYYSQKELDSFPPTEFALSIGKIKKFATMDKGNTAVSILYFLKTAPALSKEIRIKTASNLIVACKNFKLKVPEALTKIAKGISIGGSKTIKKGQHFALTSKRRYPLENTDDLRKASEYFQNFKHSLQPEERREFALNFIKQAFLENFPIPEDIQSFGGTSPNPLRREMVIIRMGFLKEPQETKMLEKILQIEDPASLANVLLRFDRLTGLKRLYGSRIPDPFETCFTSKTAEVGPNIIYQSGDVVVTDADVERVCDRPEILKKIFPDDIVFELVDNPLGTFEGLPDNHKEIIGTLAKTLEEGTGIR